MCYVSEPLFTYFSPSSVGVLVFLTCRSSFFIIKISTLPHAANSFLVLPFCLRYGIFTM